MTRLSLLLLTLLFSLSGPAMGKYSENVTTHGRPCQQAAFDKIGTPQQASREQGLYGRALLPSERINTRSRHHPVFVPSIRWGGLSGVFNLTLAILLHYAYQAYSYED
jgi:hypothetical protein